MTASDHAHFFHHGNRVGLHYSAFRAFSAKQPLKMNHLRLKIFKTSVESAKSGYCGFFFFSNFMIGISVSWPRGLKTRRAISYSSIFPHANRPQFLAFISSIGNSEAPRTVLDIPGFPWEKSLSGRHLIPGWEKIEFTAEEEDPGAVVGERAKASRVGFNLLDFAVETFSDGVGDGVEEIV